MTLRAAGSRLSPTQSALAAGLAGYVVICRGDSNWILSRLGGHHQLGTNATAGSLAKALPLNGAQFERAAFRNDADQQTSGASDTYFQTVLSNVPDTPLAKWEAGSIVDVPWRYVEVTITVSPGSDSLHPWWYTFVDKEHILVGSGTMKCSLTLVRPLNTTPANIGSMAVLATYVSAAANLNGVTLGASDSALEDTTTDFSDGGSLYIETKTLSIIANDDAAGEPKLKMQYLGMNEWAVNDTLAMSHAFAWKTGTGTEGAIWMLPLATGGWTMLTHLPVGHSNRVDRDAEANKDHAYELDYLNEVLEYIFTEINTSIKGVIFFMGTTNDWTTGTASQKLTADQTGWNGYRDRVLDIIDLLKAMTSISSRAMPLLPVVCTWMDNGYLDSVAGSTKAEHDAFLTGWSSTLAADGSFGVIDLNDAANGVTMDDLGIAESAGDVHVTSTDADDISAVWDLILGAIKAYPSGLRARARSRRRAMAA